MRSLASFIVTRIMRFSVLSAAGAKLEAPINLTKVEAVAFAPEDRLAGKLAIGQILLMK